MPPRPNHEYELPRSTYKIAGSRPAGVFSALSAQSIMARTGYLPGEIVLVWGCLPQADACAQWLERAGAQVIRVREGLITNIAGDARVASVTIEGVVYVCDALVIAEEIVPDERKGTKG